MAVGSSTKLFPSGNKPRWRCRLYRHFYRNEATFKVTTRVDMSGILMGFFTRLCRIW